MRIGYIVMGFPVISESFVMNQITGMINLGHHVEIFAQYESKDSDRMFPAIRKFGLDKKIHYLNRLPDRMIIRLFVAVTLVLKLVWRNPISIVRSLNFIRYGKYALSLRLLFQVAPFLGKSFDVIHSHFGANGNFGIILKDLGIKTAYITTFHGYDVNKVLFRKDFDFYSDLFRSGDMFTSNTEFLSRQLQRLGCPKEKIFVLPAGVEMFRFPFKRRFLNRGTTIQILTVSRLVEEKGIPFMLRAVKLLVEMGHPIHYTIVGDGPLYNDLWNLCIILGVEDNVSFVGAVEHSEVTHYFSEAHIFVLPSIIAPNGGIEAQGLVLQEAQACGLPVVGTNIGGIPEGFLNGMSGFLVQDQSPEGLAIVISKLIERCDNWPEFGRCGRAFVEKKYANSKLCILLEEIYKKAQRRPKGHLVA